MDPQVIAVMEGIKDSYFALDNRTYQAVYDVLDQRVGIQLRLASPLEGLPVLATPTPVLISCSSYLCFVLLGLLRIKLFNLKPRDKESWLLKTIILVHNCFLFLLSLYMCVGIVEQAIFNRYSLWGNPYRANETKMAKLIYIFYVSKYFEFGDTIIMVVKRSVRQISVLHVYHHCSIALIWWAIAHHAPGGDAYFSAAVNSGIHVVMYGYYLLAALIGRNDQLRRKYLWWGKYLTQMQMGQFVLNMVQAQYDLLVGTAYPSWLLQLLFYYMISLLILFGNFYVRKYLATPRRPSAKKEL
eukprot:jgi/Mesen1/8610/ME000050S08021